MKENNFNPNDVVSRALLLMKYDTKNTLTENINKVKPVVNESDAEDVMRGIGGAAAGTAAAAAAGGAATVGGAAGVPLAFSSLASFGTALANPVGIGVLVLTGVFLYAAYRNADNEGVLRKTMEACSTVSKYKKEDELMSDAALDKETHLKIATLFYQGVYHRTWGFMAGTDEEKIEEATKLMKNANIADICGIIYEYQGKDFADDLAEDLNEPDLSPIVMTFRRAASKYAGGGIKVIPEDSYNRKYYQENFPCLYQSKGTVISKVQIDPEGYTYVIIKGGVKRKKTDGTVYQRTYRFYADGGRLDIEIPKGQPKETNSTLACKGSVPVAVINDNETQIEESFNNRKPLNEVFNDKLVKPVETSTVEEDLEGWEDGKKIAKWEVWLKKYPCLKQYHPTASPQVDNMGYSYFINLNPKNNKKYRFYSDGEIWLEDGSKFIGKNWSCPERGGSVLVESFRKRLMEQIPFDIEGETDVPKVEPIKPVVVPNVGPNVKPSFTECNDFPLKKGCKGSKVGEVQACLGIKVDNKFGGETEKAISSKYNTTTVDQSTFDKIISDCKSQNTTPTTTTTTTQPQAIDPTIGQVG